MLERSSRRMVDVVVIGAGVVGCALATYLSRGGLKVALLDREDGEGRGVTSRNSGVIHSGVFSRTGTRKARSCVRGAELLYARAKQEELPHRKTGKLITAADQAGLERLEALRLQAEKNGVKAKLVDRTQALKHEPALEGAPLKAALWIPSAGIVDPHALTKSLRAEAEAHGTLFAAKALVQSLEIQKGRATVRSTRGPIECGYVVNAAGLYADEIAAMVGLRRPVHPCRGDYFRLRSSRTYSRLIYPALPASEAGLGIHLTLELDGALRLGPDVQWVLDKDDFGPPKAELNKAQKFLEAAQHLLGPQIQAADLSYDGCGIRPKRSSPVEGAADFEVLATPNCVHLLGIESPGLTAALALAEEVSGFLVPAFGAKA